VRSDVVLHEQPDGEEPIALNRNLITIGRIGTTVGWFTVFMLFMSQLFPRYRGAACPVEQPCTSSA